jgi:hypothetical protein
MDFVLRDTSEQIEVNTDNANGNDLEPLVNQNGPGRIEGKAEVAEGHQRAQGINLSNVQLVLFTMISVLGDPTCPTVRCEGLRLRLRSGSKSSILQVMN